MKSDGTRSALLLTRKEIESILSPKEVIKGVEDSYRELGLNTAIVPARTRIDMKRYNANMLVMPAYLTGMDALGTKLVTIHSENSKFNLPTVIGTIVLEDARTGVPMAILDGTYITAMRTAAAGAVAAKYLSRKDSSTATIIGTGVQGRSQMIALCEVRQIEKIFAFDVDRRRCEQYVGEMRRRINVEVIRTDNLEEAVRHSDIVITATTSPDPIIRGNWVEDGSHITGIGSHSPDARELDENVIAKASKIVLDTWDAMKVGDIAYPISKGLLKQEDIYGDIGIIVAGKKVGRESPEEITVFKSVGTAATDISTALRAYRLAQRRRVGKSVNLCGV